MVFLAARPEPVEIDLERTALVVVDMQNAFLKEGGTFDHAGFDVSGSGPAIEAIGRILAAARAAGIRVVYTRKVFEKDLSNAGGPDSPTHSKDTALVLMRKRPELGGKLLVEGSWDARIVDELRPAPGELVVPTARYTGFTGTVLTSCLREAEIRYLLFTGVATSVCVDSTARDAFFAEFWPILVEGAMFHIGPDFTRQSTIWHFEQFFGWVTEVDPVLSVLQTG